MAKTWEYNGVSLEFDAEDIETLERYENAFAEMQSAFTDLPEDAGTSARMRQYCEVMRFLFDRIFGEGTAVKLLGDKLNIGATEEAYSSFLAFVQAQTMATAERRTKLLAKYMPNRAARRTKK